MTVRVHVTVDTEFNIAGTFADPSSYRPIGAESVYCSIEGRSEGLGYLLRTLAAYDLQATFFVEALNTLYFGDEPMAEVVHDLRAEGHDIQLHLHPCWAYFRDPDWRQRLASEPPDDDASRRSMDDMVALIDLGCDVFRRWGLPKPEALRTGGLRVGMDVYRAMRERGIALASNVGIGLYRPQEPELHLYSGAHEVSGVVELPVTTYCDFRLGGRAHYKSLTITGTSWPEMASILYSARDLGVTDIVVLTHPFEFVKHRHESYRTAYVDRVNRHRLERLCEFLSAEPGFVASTLGGFIRERDAEGRNQLISVPFRHALGRMLINRINHAMLRI